MYTSHYCAFLAGRHSTHNLEGETSTHLCLPTLQLSASTLCLVCASHFRSTPLCNVTFVASVAALWWSPLSCTSQGSVHFTNKEDAARHTILHPQQWSPTLWTFSTYWDYCSVIVLIFFWNLLDTCFVPMLPAPWLSSAYIHRQLSGVMNLDGSACFYSAYIHTYIS